MSKSSTKSGTSSSRDRVSGRGTKITEETKRNNHLDGHVNVGKETRVRGQGSGSRRGK